MDLGTLEVGTFKPIPEQVAEAESSFEKQAPMRRGRPGDRGDDPRRRAAHARAVQGQVRPARLLGHLVRPVHQGDPHVQAVHREFGDDERFAMVSLSVDEKIDEPRAFQSKRQLPWTQVFLGGGIHGPTPGRFGIRAIVAVVLVGPDGRIVARGLRGEAIKKAVAEAMAK